MRKLFRLSLTLCLLFAFTVIVNASGKVINVTGEVHKKTVNSEGWQLVKKGMSLQKNDEIITGFNAQMIVRLPDESVITIKQLTHFKVNSLSVKPSKPGAGNPNNEVKLKLELGTINVNVTKTAGVAKTFDIETPNGVASVRGTIETVTFNPNLGMIVTIERGLADVDGLTRRVSVSEGNSTSINHNKKDPVSTFEYKEKKRLPIENVLDTKKMDEIRRFNHNIIKDMEKL